MVYAFVAVFSFLLVGNVYIHKYVVFNNKYVFTNYEHFKKRKVLFSRQTISNYSLIPDQCQLRGSGTPEPFSSILFSSNFMEADSSPVVERAH